MHLQKYVLNSNVAVHQLVTLKEQCQEIVDTYAQAKTVSRTFFRFREDIRLQSRHFSAVSTTTWTSNFEHAVSKSFVYYFFFKCTIIYQVSAQSMTMQTRCSRTSLQKVKFSSNLYCLIVWAQVEDFNQIKKGKKIVTLSL